jgi:peptidylprolyl isomerase
MRSLFGSSVLLLAALTIGCEDKPQPAPAPDSSAQAAANQGPKATPNLALNRGGMRKFAELQALSSGAPAASPTASAAASADVPAAAGSAIPAPADVADPPKDGEKTKSGLVTKVLSKGTGTKHPKPEDSVLVHYTGWTKDGKMFDSSVARGKPITFGVSEVIPGWTEGLQLMVEKEKRRFWIPGSLAYGDTPHQPGAPAGQLTFDVELLEIHGMPEAPSDVAAPPKDAKKTASGLFYKVLTKGKGTDHPKDSTTVVVKYTGWTKDGKAFDSTEKTGEPARFRLSQVIKGWTEGVQLMVVGEKTRFWIPGDLAYGDKPQRPGAPSGQLTFDIELIDMQ